ncbi:MAG: HAD-IIA family hydrolase [Rhizobiaceae bacterium]
MYLSEKLGPFFQGFDTRSAFGYYEYVCHRLPKADFGAVPQYAEGLTRIADQFDAFVFDAFGVLNVGTSAIPGAQECISELRRKNKRVFVVTNAASSSKPKTIEKFAALGYDFSEAEIITSRMAAEEAIGQKNIGLWGVLAGENFLESDLHLNCVQLAESMVDYHRVDGFLFLSTWNWNTDFQLRLEKTLLERPRPLVIANPDVIAPHEDRFSTEPGYCGHRIADLLNINVEFHGKPFPSVFEMVERKLPEKIDLSRICMVGDTLHTDVLGGAARGWSTALVLDHGLFRGHNIDQYINESGIKPTFIVPSI